jgi:hypothetical protein
MQQLAMPDGGVQPFRQLTLAVSPNYPRACG